jgi:hypothetical protein
MGHGCIGSIRRVIPVFLHGGLRRDLRHGGLARAGPDAEVIQDGVNLVDIRGAGGGIGRSRGPATRTRAAGSIVIASGSGGILRDAGRIGGSRDRKATNLGDESIEGVNNAGVRIFQLRRDADDAFVPHRAANVTPQSIECDLGRQRFKLGR